GQDLRIARIGRGAAEHRRRPRATPDDLVHEGELELSVAFAAELRRQMAGPEPLAPDLLAQRLDQRTGLAVPGVIHVARVREEQVDGLDLLAHEAIHPVEL